LKTVWNFSAYLLSILAKNFPGLTAKAKRIFLMALCKVAAVQVVQVSDFVLKNWNASYWSEEKEYYHDLKLMVQFLYLDLSIKTETRIRALRILLDVHMMDSLLGKGCLEIADILKLILSSIKVEKDPDVLKELFPWIFKFCQQFDNDLIQQLINSMIQGICNVSVVSNITLEEFWSRVLSNKRVKVVPSPLDLPGAFQSVNLDYAIRKILLCFALDLFEVFVDRKKSEFACTIYLWLCRIAGWHTFVDYRLRVEILEFLQHFSCDRQSRITFLTRESQKRKTAYEIYTHNTSILSVSTHSVLSLDQFMFSLISIIKYDPHPPVLLRGIEVAQISLQQQLFWIHHPVALKILSETVINSILKESACDQLQDIPTTFRKQDVYLMLYQLLLRLFSFKQSISKSLQDYFITALLFGVGRWPPIAKHCVQGLQLALYCLPQSITKYLPAILLKISQVTSSNLAIGNLEFLASLASSSDLHVNLTLEDYRRIFGVALTYLRQKGGQSAQILTLAYYVTQIWFLSIDLTERKNYIPMIIQFIVASSGNQQEMVLDESIELVLDMMIQHTCIDCSPTVPDAAKKEAKLSRTWCLGNSLVSINTTATNSYQVIIRRPAGVTVFETNLVNQVGRMSFLEKKDLVADLLFRKDSSKSH
jgi:hypothetical protein